MKLIANMDGVEDEVTSDTEVSNFPALWLDDDGRLRMIVYNKRSGNEASVDLEKLMQWIFREGIGKYINMSLADERTAPDLPCRFRVGLSYREPEFSRMKEG